MLWSLVALTAWAQTTGSVAGTVVDEAELPIPGVTVSIAGDAPVRRILTDMDGEYVVGEVPPGVYGMTFERDGLGTIAVAGVVAQVGRTTRVNATMPVLNVEILPNTFAMPCSWAVGVAGGVSPPGRDWDLSTSGPLAWSISPVLSRECAVGQVWASVDLAPGLRHTYGDTRASLVALGNLGVRWGIGRSFALGPFVALNGATVGGGTSALISLGRGVAIETRVLVLAGGVPDVQLWALIRRHHDRSRRPRPFVAARIELGSLVGLRVQPWAHLGLRVGVFSDPLTATVLQPMAVAFGDLDLWRGLGAELSLGATLRDAAVEPAAGLRLRLRRRAVAFHAGVMVAGGRVSPDVGVTFRPW